MNRRLLAPIALVALALAAGTVAHALPGQHLPVWLAWTKTNPALQPLKQTKDEMSGGTIYNKHVRAGGMAIYFAAEPGYYDGGAGPATMFTEGLSLDGPPEGYDLRAHRATAVKMAKIVYGPTVATDVQNAVVAGDFAIYQTKDRISVLKGKLYAYQLSGPGMTVGSLKSLPQVLKNLEQCATIECGD